MISWRCLTVDDYANDNYLLISDDNYLLGRDQALDDNYPCTWSPCSAVRGPHRQK